MILKVTKGMKIEAFGERVTIGDIIYQFCDTAENSYRKPWADIEFRDSNGNYRHWQSWSDGGKLILQNGTEYKFEREG